MTLTEYQSAEPQHLAVVEWWEPRPDHRPYAVVYRATFYAERVAWLDHPWSEGRDGGRDIENEWLLEQGPSLDRLTGRGRTAEGWRALLVNRDQGCFDTRLEALHRALDRVNVNVHGAEKRLRGYREDQAWIESAIKGIEVEAAP